MSCRGRGLQHDAEGDGQEVPAVRVEEQHSGYVVM